MHEAALSITTGSGEMGGYYARPEADGPFAAVVLIHELFGLNDNIRDVTRRLAAEGYAALAVDLFSGRNRAICMARFMGGLLFNTLGNRTLQDLRSTLTQLGARPEVDSGRIGAIGFCMGGSFAIAWAATDRRLKVIAPFYGMNPRPLEAVQRSCPVVGSYPEQDFTARGAGKLQEALEQYQVPYDIKVYPGARHSFFNDQGDNHDPAASADAWQRTLDYFQEYLS